MDFRCRYSASIHILLSERINKTLRETVNYSRLYHFLNLPLIPPQKLQCSVLPVLRYEYVSE